MKKVVLTFDDARKDFVTNAFPLLNKYNFKATLYVVGGYVEGFIEPDFSDVCTIKDIDLLFNNGIEIGNHTYSHGRLVSFNDLEKNHFFLKRYSPSTIAIPYYNMPSKECIEFLSKYNYSYIRVGEKKSSFNLKRKILSFLFLITKNKKIHEACLLLDKRKNVIKEKKHNIVNSIMVLDSHSPQYLVQLVKKMKKNDTIIFTFHSIKNKNDNFIDFYEQGSWSEEKFELFLKLLKEQKVTSIRMKDL